MKNLKKFFAVFMAVLFAFCWTSCQAELENNLPVTYKVTVASDIKNGTVKVTPTEAEKGTSIKITATPADSYELDSYSVKDSKGNTINVTENSFTMPESNVTVSAHLQKSSLTTP